MFSFEELQEIELFLDLLYPWDDDGSNLFKSVTWSFVGKEGKGFANYAAQSKDDLRRLIEVRAARPAADVYVALSTQRVADMSVRSQDGFAKAIRRYENLVSLKSIWLDIDVGKKDAYATTEDAFAALDDFVARVGMPKPTMVVYSGSGGLHVYWCFADPIPLAQWLPLAKALQAAALHAGLKFDPQVTVNPVGVLRVPNTLNHKTFPPRKVRLYQEESYPLYGFQQMLGMLGAYTSTAHLRQAGANQAPTRNKNFIANTPENAPPVPIDDVAANCAALDDILQRGGNGDGEPLWNLALYAAAFTDNPHDAAHRLGNQHADYTFDSTEKKLLEKINARAANINAGWPTCESFSALHPACASCPLFAQKKTPFHHARRPSAPQATSFMPVSDDQLMPPNYWRGKDNNHVFTTLYAAKTGLPYVEEIIPYPILDAGIDTVSGDLLFRTAVGGEQRWGEVTAGHCMKADTAATALAQAGVFTKHKNHPAIRDFLVAWVTHLQTLKRSAGTHTYGWTGDSFVYDGKLYGPNGTDIIHRGRHIDKNFKVLGDLKPWQEAMPLIYGNMALEAVVATAFAAPLLELSGGSSLVVSLYSNLSGIGKTTAMELAQSVWGHPRAGMTVLHDTTNSVMKKIGDLKNLPIYWDELRTREQLEKVVDIVFQVTQGKSKSRLTRDAMQADAPVFTTMFVVASNYGIADTVFSQTESTEAGGLRVFEIQAGPMLESCKINYGKANDLLLALKRNYGCAGAAYAEWLAANRGLAVAAMKAVGDYMDQAHKFEAKERFWRMSMVSILVGATLANHCGLTSFDLPGLSAFLDDVLMRQRSGMKDQEYSTMSTVQDVEGLLQEMASELRGRSLIITETLPYTTMGKPRPNNLVDTDLSRLGDVWMQYGHRDKRIRVRARPFKEWLRKRHLNPKTIIEALGKHYKVTQGKVQIGVGVPGLDALNIARSECLDFTPLPAIARAPTPGSDAPT